MGYMGENALISNETMVPMGRNPIKIYLTNFNHY